METTKSSVLFSLGAYRQAGRSTDRDKDDVRTKEQGKYIHTQAKNRELQARAFINQKRLFYLSKFFRFFLGVVGV
jgi:hypothetical protein